MNPLGAFARGRFRAALAPTKTAQCVVKSASSGFATTVATVACHYEQTAATRGQRLDFDGADPDGYTVWFDAPVAIGERDTVEVDGITIQVTRVVPTGNLSSGPRIEGSPR